MMARRLTQFLSPLMYTIALAVPLSAHAFDIERHMLDNSVRASALTRDSSRKFSESDLNRFIEDVRTLGASTISVVLDIEWTPEGYLSNEEITAQRERIAEAQAKVIAELSRYGMDAGAYRYAYVPGMEVEFAEQAVLALVITPVVKRLEVSAPALPATPQSTNRIEAPALWERGFNGTGWVVALLDTGVTPIHSALSNKIVGEACFSKHEPGADKFSLCFGGGTSVSESTQSGSAIDCSGATGCGHGTRMAGIIAAATQGNVTGVAPDAKLFPVQVFRRDETASCSGSNNTCAHKADIAKALQHIYSLRNQFQFAAVNLSLASGSYGSSCNGVNSNTTNNAANLRSVGIIPVAAAGNANSKTGIGWPSCISHILSVGAVTATDTVLNVNSSLGSNSASILDIWAPGGNFDITTTDKSGSTSLTGFTSAASAHVAGAIAAIRDGYAGVITANTIVDALKAPGILVTDPANGVQKPRIALELSLPPTGFTVLPSYCYGWTDFAWSAVSPWSAIGGSLYYQLELRPYSPAGASPYPIYSGSSTSSFINVAESGEARIRICRGSRCGGRHVSATQVVRYEWCQ